MTTKSKSAPKTKPATRKITIEVDPFTFGLLSAASVVHNCTVDKAAEKFLRSGALCDWSNEGFELN